MDSCYSLGEPLNKDLLDENTSWHNTIETLQNELSEVGVGEDHVQKLACFLYASYLNHQPLLLAGPHGSLIADAFSASLCGKTAGVLDCDANISPDTLRETESSDDQIVVIRNMFCTLRLPSIIDLLQSTKKQYFVVHPFVEDLVIEPRSLYDYMHPVFTGIFIDQFPSRNIVGGICASSYEQHISVRAASDTLLRRMNLSKYADRRLRQVLADARDMLGSEHKDMDFLLAYLPYAYVTGQTELLTDVRQTLSKSARECIARFMDD